MRITEEDLTCFSAAILCLLGLWKLVEIVIWLCHNLHFGATP